MDDEGAKGIVVVGASAGGVAALSALFSDLPCNIPAAFFVVLHLSQHCQSHLPAILTRTGRLPAVHPFDGQKFKPGKVYVAPPGFDMTVGAGVVRLSQSPLVQHPQPAIDPLFYSAAHTYGHRVAGVLLTGMLRDGVAGLKEIRKHGGLAIVQDPVEARFPDLPQNALDAVEVDACLPVAQIRDLVTHLPHLTRHHKVKPSAPRTRPVCFGDNLQPQIPARMLARSWPSP